MRAFVRIDTSNPPGNETRGAEFLKAILDKAGIPAELLGDNPARLNLVARLKGSGKKRPLVLMGHLDVVGIERDKWTVEPFAGVMQDGFLYGRGASDDKCMTTVCLEVMLLLKRLNVPLDRDVIFVAEADEESSSRGIIELIEKHWDKIDCEFALNEGGGIVEENGKVRYVGVSTSEKVPRTLFLASKGTSGHGSRPRPDNALVHLAAAVAKAGAWQPPVRLNDTTRTYFQRLAQISPPEEAWLYTHFNDPVVGAQVQEIFRLTEKYYTENSILRTSISPTVMKSGFRFNVIPGDGLATLDVRALPDEDMPAFVKTLEGVINDPAITITAYESPSNMPATPPSRLDTEMFAALERKKAQQAVFPGTTVIPTMLTGATDSAFLRAKGVQAYGLGSVFTYADGGNRAPWQRRARGRRRHQAVSGICLSGDGGCRGSENEIPFQYPAGLTQRRREHKERSRRSAISVFSVVKPPYMPIEYRLAVLADIPALEELIPLSARQLQQGYYSPEQIEGAIGTVFGVDSQLIKDGTYFVATEGDAVVGCGGWSKQQTLYGGDRGKKARTPCAIPRPSPAMIRAFFVHPGFARRGHRAKNHGALRSRGEGRRILPHRDRGHARRRAALCGVSV